MSSRGTKKSGRNRRFTAEFKQEAVRFLRDSGKSLAKREPHHVQHEPKRKLLEQRTS